MDADQRNDDEAAGVDYLFIGKSGAILLGYPGTTQDVDLSPVAILLDFHYSDTWADPSKQGIPASWPQDSLPALTTKVEDYTFETLRRFADEGVFPELVQIGNEIENGLLWPHGEIFFEKGKAPDWDGAATLFKSAARGVRRATPEGLKPRFHPGQGSECLDGRQLCAMAPGRLASAGTRRV